MQPPIPWETRTPTTAHKSKNPYIHIIELNHYDTPSRYRVFHFRIRHEVQSALMEMLNDFAQFLPKLMLALVLLLIGYAVAKLLSKWLSWTR